MGRHSRQTQRAIRSRAWWGVARRPEAAIDPVDDATTDAVLARSAAVSVKRVAIAISFALAATFTGSVGLFSASAQIIAPSYGSTTTSSSALPVCPPGQEATTVAGSGTPAPLGNLQNLPAGVAGGGTFGGVALNAEQVKMAAIVAAVGKQMGITRRGIEIGIAVATEQSSLRPDAVNEAWLGLFQQNPVDYTM